MLVEFQVLLWDPERHYHEACATKVATMASS